MSMQGSRTLEAWKKWVEGLLWIALSRRSAGAGGAVLRSAYASTVSGGGTFVPGGAPVEQISLAIVVGPSGIVDVGYSVPMSSAADGGAVGQVAIQVDGAPFDDNGTTTNSNESVAVPTVTGAHAPTRYYRQIRAVGLAPGSHTFRAMFNASAASAANVNLGDSNLRLYAMG